MKLKTYQARSMSDALAKVKKDLGRDAVILHTRTIKRGGVLGLGSHAMIEITATADQKVQAFRKAAANDAPVRQPQPQAPAAAQRTVPAPAAVPADDIRREVIEIRALVEDLVRRTEQAGVPSAPNELVPYYTHLLGQDVAEELAREVVGKVTDSVNDNAHWDASGRLVTHGVEPARVHTELERVISDMLPSASPLKLKESDGPTVVALVGPTGVGKTTTIAKLAANMKLRERKTVGLITIDSYRIAAVEQLKTYAQILKIPLVSVLTPDDMAAAVQRMANLDLVLIDTAGRSQKDDLRIAELAGFLEAARPDEVHLVLSTTSREGAIREAIERFGELGADHLIFTKTDEAVGFGVILNVLQSAEMRLSYLTNGQAVPDDIEVGSAGRVARLLLEGLSVESATPAPEAEGSPA